jgi:hypothetical protein
MSLRVSSKAGNFLTSWPTVSFSRSSLLHGASYNSATFAQSNTAALCIILSQNITRINVLFYTSTFITFGWLLTAKLEKN